MRMIKDTYGHSMVDQVMLKSSIMLKICWRPLVLSQGQTMGSLPSLTQGRKHRTDRMLRKQID